METDHFAVKEHLVVHLFLPLTTVHTYCSQQVTVNQLNSHVVLSHAHKPG